ncbi:MAG: divergent polysaccharide deacetylase family protein [Campylobacterota bacterium]|nr:divergent polysaccharide deacetylase family protein [Campylobacterota bacterium]
MAKRKTNKKNGSSKILTYIAWGLTLIALVISSLVFGYYLGYDDALQQTQKEEIQEKKNRLAVLKKLENSLEEKPKADVKKRLKEVLKKESKHYISASHEIDSNSLAHIPKRVKREVKISSNRPKLAIIIDDVGTKSQVNAIKSLRLPLTMSFLPPSKARPHTPALAAKENRYMIHLPMEALNWNAEEPFTLHTQDSQALISKRVKELKELFPKVKYINNHTGSKFTSNEISMNRLIYALNANNIKFIDSRTTAQTQAPKVLKNFGLQYVGRDVFLDHHMEKSYVLTQIKKAIDVAKRHGTAIAIGHPHKNTLQALYESKKLFKDIELVYIDRLH